MSSTRKHASSQRLPKQEPRGKKRSQVDTHSEVTNEAILGRFAQKGRELYRQHGKLDLPPEWETNWHPEVVRLLREFLQTGNFARLEEMLRGWSISIKHELVLYQLRHLRKLALMPTEKDRRDAYEHNASVPPIDETVAEDLKEQALATLCKLLEAWLPGFSVEIREYKFKRPRGRPVEMLDGCYDSQSLRDDFTDLRYFAESCGNDALKRMPDESPMDFAQRTTNLVQHIHLDFNSIPQMCSSQYCCEVAGVDFPKPLPSEIALNIAHQACQEKIVSVPVLLHELLAHYLYTTPDTIRGRLQRASKPTARNN